MPIDLEKLLRPVDTPVPPFPPKFMKVASGEDMVVRQVSRDEIPQILPYIEPLLHVERDYYDIVSARVYAELLAYYTHRVQDEYVLVAQINGELAAVVNGRFVNKDVGMSYHTLALRRGLRVGEHTMIPAAPIVANAVEDALGIRMKSMPITAEKLALELKGIKYDDVKGATMGLCFMGDADKYGFKTAKPAKKG